MRYTLGFVASFDALAERGSPPPVSAWQEGSLPLLKYISTPPNSGVPAWKQPRPTTERERGGIYICASCNVEMWILQSTPIVHKHCPRVQGRPPSLSPALSLRSSQEVKSDLVVSLMFGVTDVPPSTSIASSARL